MTDIIASRTILQNEEVAARAAVSESTLTRFGATNNFLSLYQHNAKEFFMNGVYKAPINGVDGLYVFQFNSEIIGLTLSNLSVGASGTSEIDIKYISSPGTVVGSIFSTTPKFDSTSSDNTYLIKDLIDSNDVSPTGATLPVFSKTTFLKGEAIRVDLLTAMTGGETLGVIVNFRPIN